MTKKNHPYQNADLPIEQRCEDLMSRMTLDEKLAQVMSIWNLKKEFMTGDGGFVAERPGC
jgi:beta-glucosidase